MAKRGNGADWKNRVVGWDTVDPESLLANPDNYRRHPGVQRDALRGSLDELGIVAPVLVNTVTGHVFDGHARVEEYLAAGIKEVPVVYVEMSAEDEKLALASMDPIAAMAEVDARSLDALLADISTQDEGLRRMLVGLAQDAGLSQYGIDHAFEPNTEPVLGMRDVTEGDVTSAESGLAVGGGDRDLVRVLCPHCGKPYFLDPTALVNYR